LVIIVLLELYDPLLVQTEPSGIFQVLRRYLTVTHVALERYVLEMPLRCPSTFPLAKHPAFLLAFLVPLGTFVIGLLRFRWFVPQVFFALKILYFLCHVQAVIFAHCKPRFQSCVLQVSIVLLWPFSRWVALMAHIVTFQDFLKLERALLAGFAQVAKIIQQFYHVL
jgi:hypothetical protein